MKDWYLVLHCEMVGGNQANTFTTKVWKLEKIKIKIREM